VKSLLWNLPGPLAYLITDRHQLKSKATSGGFQALLDFIDLAFSSGIDLVQIRERDLSALDVYQITRTAVQSARVYGGTVLVNDRADIAAAAGAGVHLTTHSIDASIIRKCFGSRMLIGESTHSLNEAKAAEQSGADFIVFGPVFETESKRVYGPPVGIKALQEAACAVQIPVLALGGINNDNLRSPIAAGAAGIAGISLFAGANDLGRVIETIKRYK